MIPADHWVSTPTGTSITHSMANPKSTTAQKVSTPVGCLRMKS